MKEARNPVINPKPYSVYKDSGVEWLGEVPEHWDVARLKSHLCRNDSGLWGNDFSDKGTIVLRSTEQTIAGGWRIVSPARINLSMENLEAALLKSGDLVVTKSSGSQFHIGKTSLVNDEIQAMRCCFSNFMQRLRLDEVTQPAFVWWNLNSSVGREQLVYQSTTTTGLGNLNGTILGNCLLAFPPLSEQTAIVRYLDYVERRVRRYVRGKRKLVRLLEEQRQAVIHRAVTRGLDPDVPLKDSGVEWLGKVPEHWDVRQLGRIGGFSKGSGGTKEDAVDAGIPCVRYGDLYTQHQIFVHQTKSYVSEMKAAAYTPLQYGDVLFAGSGETIEDIGKSAVNLLTGPACCGGDVILFRPSIDVNAKFLGYATACPHVAYQKSSMGRGITIMHIYSSELKYLFVALPPLPEQIAIAEYLDKETAKIDTAIARTRRQVGLVEEYRTRLIADVVTGKIDVREEIHDQQI